ncbi:SurA N-terminal domain-containing protein [Desulfobacterales bacterium HSG2]|nr:SurA N-terminal domain-containing protein [Desulfobacterales bacterium HSG2]
MRRYNFLLIGVLSAVCVLAGCPELDNKHDGYLIRVGDSVATVADFNNALDISKTAYPREVTDNPASLKAIQLQVLKQISERLILLERAKDIHIKVPDSELEAAIADIKSDYPEGEFEKTLLESAISYDFWKKELKARMLMEKVVAKELGERIVVTPEDLAAYHKEHGNDGDRSDKSDDIAAKRIYRKKSEDAYQSWIKELGKKYRIEINQAEWERITDS